MTICWTSDDCDGQVDLKLHLSVGQVILFPYFDHCIRMGARWPSGIERWLALATGRCGTGSNPTADNFASENGNSVYPALPVSFGGD